MPQHPNRTRISLRFRRISPLALPPAYATSHSAGMDLHAAMPKPVRLRPGDIRLIPTGLELEIPDGYEGQVRPRSGLALKYGLSIVNAPGTIDADYRGEVGVILINLGRRPIVIKPGDRVAQLVISPVASVKLVERTALKKTKRGRGGFGHTGTK